MTHRWRNHVRTRLSSLAYTETEIGVSGLHRTEE
nr:MAG TPA: hypothetical protein [Caudoviricetes sp.]